MAIWASLKRTGKLLDAGDGRADADERLDVMVALQCITMEWQPAFRYRGVDVVGLDLLDQDDVVLVDVKDEVLLFVREQILTTSYAEISLPEVTLISRTTRLRRR